MANSLLERGECYLQNGLARLGRNSPVYSFKKCVAADGSEDFEIHLEGLEDYI